MRTEAFDYGRYDNFFADPRTHKVIKIVDALAKKMGIQYALIGGSAAYLYVKNPPDDIPDLDFLVYADAVTARRLVEAISQKPKFALRILDFDEDDDMMFAGFIYDHDIQVDVFTSYDERAPRATKRKGGTNLEPVEPLIVEKLIRSNEADIRTALDLLAFTDYDKRLVSQIAQEYRATGMLQHAAYFARRMAAGKMTKAGIDAVVKRLSK